MRYFLDCEFIEDGTTIDLISIGIVAEDGREYYACNTQCSFWKASRRVIDNVLNGLPIKSSEFWKPKYEIVNDILKFCDLEQYGKPEFWGEWASYDWVAFCQLFGTMMDLPDGYPMRINDVIQYAEMIGFLNHPRWPQSLETEGYHNALLGARTVHTRWKFCNEISIELGLVCSNIPVESQP